MVTNAGSGLPWRGAATPHGALRQAQARGLCPQHDNSGVEPRKCQLCQQPVALLLQFDKAGIARVGRAVVCDEAQYLLGCRAGMAQLLHRAAITPELVVGVRQPANHVMLFSLPDAKVAAVLGFNIHVCVDHAECGQHKQSSGNVTFQGTCLADRVIARQGRWERSLEALEKSLLERLRRWSCWFLPRAHGTFFGHPIADHTNSGPRR